MTEDERIELWMKQNRLKRAVAGLEKKIINARRRKFKSVLLPVEEAESLLEAIRGSS